ncbi:hypothetical protein INR49_007140 [Caranx melampygus]|nr:hypothetical protein INR49_007140 [Caranx melampygus]
MTYLYDYKLSPDGANILCCMAPPSVGRVIFRVTIRGRGLPPPPPSDIIMTLLHHCCDVIMQHATA